MARILIPIRFVDQVALFKSVRAKHIADGAGSVLNTYLTEQGINLSTDNTAADNANNAHTSFLALEKTSEELSEQRDNLFERVFKEHKKCVQFLKKLYRSSVQRLGEWGVTVDNRARVVYPPDFLQRKQAVIAFIDYHDFFTPPTSPLQPFIDANGLDLSVNRTDADAAETIDGAFDTAIAQKEEQRELRDQLFGPVVEHLRGIAAFLIGLYPNQPHLAGRWGFTVDESPQADHIRTYSLSSGEIKTVKNVSLKSKLRNNGSTTLELHSGTDVNNTPIVLNPNQEFTITRGYGTITVVNTSNAGNGSFEVEINV